MRKPILSSLVMLSFCLSAVAQTASASSDTKKSSHTKSAKTVSLTGCLSEHDGGYMLTNKAHPDGVMLTSTEDLKAHIGHKVSVSGTMSKHTGGDEKSKMMDMQVKTFKHISEKCETSTSMKSTKKS